MIRSPAASTTTSCSPASNVKRAAAASADDSLAQRDHEATLRDRRDAPLARRRATPPQVTTLRLSE
ncbi:hypothetical protein [Nannocystis pusilla]|uniref:hypothetical protein n=1 Tax=Nannocystis pusilla TaxID=889268 RepID=UPI003DA2B336